MFLAAARSGISQNMISPVDPTDTTIFSSGLIFTALMEPECPWPMAIGRPSS
jgi:hypothetical protein